LSGWVTAGIKMLPNMVVAIFVLVIFWILGLVAYKLVHQGTLRVTKREHIAGLFSKLAQLAVFAIGIILALDILNLEKGVASLLAGIGILGVAFGFASQDIVKNFIAGVLLVFWRPFKVGDLIKIGDFFGFIDAIHMRSTTGTSLLGHKSILPNKTVLGSPIQSFTSADGHRVVIACGVPIENDLRRVEELALKAVESLENLPPGLPVEVFFEEFTPKSINFSIRFWCRGGQQDYVKTRSEAIKNLKRILDENGISLLQK
jgi:small conductance mechanosensitive channel